jgi:hypothetical protein
MLKLVSSRPSPRPSVFRRLVSGFARLFQQAFPMPNAPDPGGPVPPIANAARLVEGAVLSEHIDARSRKIVA